MAKTEKRGTVDKTLTTAQTNNSLSLANQQKAALQAFSEVKDEELLELTSNLLKLEQGEVWNGIITNEKTVMSSTDEDGKDYEGYIGFDKDMNRTTLSDAVVIGAMDEHFAKSGAQYAIVRISCKGMKKSAKDAKKEYRDLTVRIAPPKQIEA